MSKRKKNKKQRQQAAIRAYYAKKSEQERANKPSPSPRSDGNISPKKKEEFPTEFPFWARLKIGKNRTTLVIDEEKVINKKTKKVEDGFVDREATHTYKKEYQEIKPNPDEKDPKTMYLRRPRKRPKRLYDVNTKNLTMPEFLKEQYSKNNKKNKGDGNDKK